MVPRRLIAAFLAYGLVAALLPITAIAQNNPIVERMAALGALYNAKDAAGIASFYTEDGVLLAPESAAVVGRGPIADHYGAAFDAGVSQLRYEIKDIRAHGPTSAVEIGETLVTLGSQTIHGRYLHVWVLQEGVWFLSRDMYHLIGLR